MKSPFTCGTTTPKQEFLSSVRLLQEHTNVRVDESKFIMTPHKTVVMRCPDNPDCCNEKTHDRKVTFQRMRFVYAVHDLAVEKQTHNFKVIYVDNHVKCECIKKT
ncbi:hypothetical protein B566_EDAN007800 [Ephemera danica]|nr:hypothetical protein B566_EDAN007800 [Ephemera danica]